MSPSTPPQPTPAPLPLRWAVILMGAFLAGLLVGALTLAQTGLWPAALLATLGAAGATAPTLHAVLAPER